MTESGDGPRILGSLRAEGGVGVVRMEDRYDTSIDDLWSALTNPERLNRWISTVEGDLRAGGAFRAQFHDAGMDVAGRVDRCEPPERLRVTLRDADPQPGQPEQTVIEATLTADGDQTILVVEESGIPLNLLYAYGAGVQIHLENLAAHLAGRDLAEESRWEELLPAYRRLAADIG